MPAGLANQSATSFDFCYELVSLEKLSFHIACFFTRSLGTKYKFTKSLLTIVSAPARTFSKAGTVAEESAGSWVVP